MNEITVNKGRFAVPLLLEDGTPDRLLIEVVDLQFRAVLPGGVEIASDQAYNAYPAPGRATGLDTAGQMAFRWKLRWSGGGWASWYAPDIILRTVDGWQTAVLEAFYTDPETKKAQRYGPRNVSFEEDVAAVLNLVWEKRWAFAESGHDPAVGNLSISGGGE